MKSFQWTNIWHQIISVNSWKANEYRCGISVVLDEKLKIKGRRYCTTTALYFQNLIFYEKGNFEITFFKIAQCNVNINVYIIIYDYIKINKHKINYHLLLDSDEGLAMSPNWLFSSEMFWRKNCRDFLGFNKMRFSIGGSRVWSPYQITVSYFIIYQKCDWRMTVCYQW